MAFSPEQLTAATVFALLLGASVGAILTKEASSCIRIVSILVFAAQYAAAVALFGMTLHCMRLCVLFTMLTTAAICDLESLEIPNAVPIAAVLGYMAFLPFEEDLSAALINGAMGAFTIGAGIFLLSLCADAVTGKETLGGGDIKLFAVTGLYLGALNGVLAVLASCITGLVFCAVKRIGKSVPFPFAPSIAFGAFAAGTVGEKLINLYLGLFL